MAKKKGFRLALAKNNASPVTTHSHDRDGNIQHILSLSLSLALRVIFFLKK